MSLYENTKKVALLLLRDQEFPSTEQIRLCIQNAVKTQRAMGRTEYLDEEALYRDILSQVNTWQATPSILRDGKHVDWLPLRKSKIEWNFWKRYQQYLEDEKNWPLNLTAKLDRITDSILGDIGNPAENGNWDRRGMVVGEVQSGKTGNYTGLICKAVDSGYKLIIVLAGMTNDLRSQTQARLDSEFLGFESHVERVRRGGSRIGVGKIHSASNLIAHPLTYSSQNGDFRVNNSANLQIGGSPLLLVVKKNTSVLKRILAWVQNQGKKHPETGKKIIDGIPLLLIDDEADNASVNTNTEDEDPTAINAAIRKILNSFQQSSYVGYTATPFANIFILPDEVSDPDYGDDLFPKGFIYYISPPSNYIGPAQLFGLKEDLDGSGNYTRSLPLVRKVNDSEIVFPLAHKRDLRVEKLPDSLIQAIYTFVITCAARRVRGQQDVHNSMLIHVTRYNDVQRKVIDLVNDELTNIRRIIENNTGAQASRLFERLQNIWNDDFSKTSESVRQITGDIKIIEIQWEDVRSQLLFAINKIVVRGINGDTGGVLDYDNHPIGLNVIAVGGDKLSRGLTLEGLSVSYYTRPAKNYDTLLQMGRWFGYRPGYVDLCRLFTTNDLVSWYEHIAVANEELRREFTFMELSRKTPEDYGLKVRTHPNGLSITAANKLRNGRTLKVSFSGHLSQTTVFHKGSKVHESNFDAAETWLSNLKNPESYDNRVVWKQVTPNQINQFLVQYTSHPMCRKAEPDLLVKYIEKLNSYKELLNWTVALISNSESKEDRWLISDKKIGLVVRGDNTPDDDSLYMLNKSNILNPPDERIDFLDMPEGSNLIDMALQDNIAAWSAGETRSKYKPEKPSGPFVRNVRPPQNGLLLIYPLEHRKFSKPFCNVPIIGFAISFPKSRYENVSAIEYQVNTTYWRERYGVEENDED